VSPTGEIHTILAVWIAHLLLLFVDAHDLGEVTSEIGGYRLAPDTVLAPDVGFISKARLVTPTGQGYIPLAPDLAVEIMSPGDKASEINDKVLLYLQAGIRLIWVVYPSSKTITVYKPSDNAKIVDINGILDGGDILPGFSLPVRDIFKKLRE
jgi:Uma2 family endonuclease